MRTVAELKAAARACLKAGKPRQAQAVYAQAVRQARAEGWGQADALVLEALRQLASEDAAAAQEAAEAALALSPDHREALHCRAEAARRLARAAGDDRACELHLVGRVARYRELASTIPQEGEVVVEVGASTGETTSRLARRAAKVVAIELTAHNCARLRTRFGATPNVGILQCDAWDLGTVAGRQPRADVVFIDVGGSAPAGRMLDLARKYRHLLGPRAMVLRNTELNDFVDSLASHEQQAGVGRWSHPRRRPNRSEAIEP